MRTPMPSPPASAAAAARRAASTRRRATAPKGDRAHTGSAFGSVSRGGHRAAGTAVGGGHRQPHCPRRQVGRRRRAGGGEAGHPGPIELLLRQPHLFASAAPLWRVAARPPGTGKTLLVPSPPSADSFLSVKGPEPSRPTWESERQLRGLCARTRAAPCVIFDEIDARAGAEATGDAGGVMDRIVSQLMAIDGVHPHGAASRQQQLFVLGATNRPDLLDLSLLRPGRFDKLVAVEPPRTHEQQTAVLRALTRKFVLAPDVDLARVPSDCHSSSAAPTSTRSAPRSLGHPRARRGRRACRRAALENGGADHRAGRGRRGGRGGGPRQEARRAHLGEPRTLSRRRRNSFPEADGRRRW